MSASGGKHTQFVHHSKTTIAAAKRYALTHKTGAASTTGGHGVHAVDKHAVAADSFASAAATGARRPGAKHELAAEMSSAPSTHAAELRKHKTHHEEGVKGTACAPEAGNPLSLSLPLLHTHTHTHTHTIRRAHAALSGTRVRHGACTGPAQPPALGRQEERPPVGDA